MKPTAFLRSFLFVSGSSLLAVASVSAATFYWDANGTAGGFGNATGGAWSEDNTSASSPGTGRWTTDATGVTAGSATQLTANTDTFNFGTATLGLTAGTINITGTVNMGSTTYGAASGAIVLTGGTIAYSAAPTITVNNATNTINSIIGGAATSFTKAGAGTLILGGNNTYAGSTIVNAGTLAITGAPTGAGAITLNGGTLNLGNSSATGSLASSTLTLAGGAFSYTRTGGTTQGFTTTNINSGGSGQISVVSGNTLNLGTVVRGAGGALNFASVGSGTVAALTVSNTNGIMGGFTFGDTWAVAGGAGVAISGLANASYTLTSVAGTTGASYLNGNIDVDNSAGLLDAAITANSLRFSTAVANTLDLATGTNIISSGGILVGSAVGTNLSTISGGTLTGAANKDLSVIQNNASEGLTISSVIANNTSTSLTKSGAGLLTLSGNNTFTGGLTIHVGSVALGNTGALNSTAGSQNAVGFGAGSTGTLALTGNSVVFSNLSTNAGTPGTTFVQNANGSSVSNATLTVGNASNLSGAYAGIIRDGTGGGTLALTKAGTGTLTLSGANTYTGGTTLTAGVVVISNATSFGAGNVLVTGSSRINATGGITYTNAISVGADLTMQNPNTTTSTATFSGVLSGASNLSLANSGTNGVQGIIAFTNTANTFTGNIVLSASGAGDEHFQFNSIGDGGNFTFAKNGNRQLITHTGSSNITFATRTINIASTMTNINTRQGLDGGGGNPVTSFFSSGSGTITFNSAMGMTSLASDGVFYFNGTNTGDNTFGGTIGDPTGTGKLWIGKLGTGTWLLTGDNTYEGGTIIAGGILSVGKIEVAANAQPLGKGSIIQFGVGNNGASGNLVFTGSTTSTTDKQVVIGAMSQANGLGTGGVINNGSGTLTFSNATFNPTISGNVVSGITTTAVTVARTLTIGGSNANANTISGIIQDNNTAGGGLVAITKTGTGAWTLSNAASSYTGTTTIQAGALVAGANAPSAAVGAFGNSSSAIVLGNGSTLAGDAPSLLINGAFTVGRAITVGSVAAAGVAYNATIGGSNTTGTSNFTGNITLNTTANSYTATLQAATGGTVNFSTGTWTTNNKAIAIGSSGNTGTVQISNAIATSGGINLNYGTLTLNSAFTAGNMTVASGTTLGGTGSVAGTTGVTSATVNGTGLVLTGTTTFSGLANTLSGTVTSTAGVTVASAAVLANNGTLTGAVGVSATGTLQGSGAISGAVTVAGTGILAPGNSIESLSAGSLSMAASSTYQYEVADNTATGADLLAVGGTISLTNVTLSLDAATIAALGGGGWSVGNKLTLISYLDGGSGITSGFTGYVDDTSYFFGANEWEFDYNDTGAGANFNTDATAASQNRFVTMTLVPEPSTALLGGLGLLALLRRRR